MNTRGLPRTLLVALGLGGCGDDDGGTSGMTTTACLIAPFTESAESLTATDSATGQDTESATDTESSTVGPCLIAPPGTASSGTDTDTDTGSDTGTDTGDSSTTAGSTSDAQLDDHDAIVDRLLDRGVLPPDVAARLRAR